MTIQSPSSIPLTLHLAVASRHMDFKNVFAHASMAHTFIANLHGSELLHLLDDGGNGARTNGTATLTDSETQTLLHSYWMNQLYSHLYVIAWHTHLNALW